MHQSNGAAGTLGNGERQGRVLPCTKASARQKPWATAKAGTASCHEPKQARDGKFGWRRMQMPRRVCTKASAQENSGQFLSTITGLFTSCSLWQVQVCLQSSARFLLSEYNKIVEVKNHRLPGKGCDLYERRV